MAALGQPGTPAPDAEGSRGAQLAALAASGRALAEGGAVLGDDVWVEAAPTVAYYGGPEPDWLRGPAEREWSIFDPTGRWLLVQEQNLVVSGPADDPRLPEPVDLLFTSNTYHHLGDRSAYFRRVRERSLRPGGRVQVADICVERPVPEEAMRDIDLWTG